jgi:hypothetical protein
MQRLAAATIAICLAATLAGCGSQKEDFKSGPGFCQSYEDNYMYDCQSNCEGEDQYSNVADQETVATCRKQCRGDLTDDSQFNKSCSDRVSEIESEG